ncbi:MAG: hypothetical protein J6X31_07355 [Bacteroidales bacterium]|nr:hypothetical protein [Bacteroidales bacterium]
MKRIIYLLTFLSLTIGDLSLAQSKNGYKVAQLIEAFQKDVSGNIELSECRNELLFEVVGSDCLVKFLKKVENDTLLQKKICAELENPVSDDINLQQLLEKLSSVPSEYSKVCEKMKTAINRAMAKCH